jgi:RNA polymerase sigma factor (sigma-70 family)
MNQLQKHLVDNYQPYSKYAIKYSKCPQMAEDAISELFLKLQNAKTVPDNLDAFITGCIKNTCKTLAKTANKYNHTFMPIDFRAEHDFLATVSTAEYGQDEYVNLKTEIQKLGPKSRKVVETMLQNDTTLVEVASILGANYDTTKALYGYALKSLKNKLKF